MNSDGFHSGKLLLRFVFVLGLALVETMWETNYVGEAFVVEWAIFVGWAADWEGFRYWLNNFVCWRGSGALCSVFKINGLEHC